MIPLPKIIHMTIINKILSKWSLNSMPTHLLPYKYILMMTRWHLLNLSASNTVSIPESLIPSLITSKMSKILSLTNNHQSKKAFVILKIIKTNITTQWLTNKINPVSWMSLNPLMTLSIKVTQHKNIKHRTNSQA